MPKHSKTKHQKSKQVAPEDRPLTAFQRKCVECFKGNKTQAVVDAGSKSKTPEQVASELFSRPNVQAALKKKEDAFVTQVGKREANGVKVTRNDIINRLDTLSEKAETDAAKVSALRELKDIFGMSSRNSDHDLFAGWTLEELESYHRSGALPARYAQPNEAQPANRA
jgi:hypothetical protein